MQYLLLIRHSLPTIEPDRPAKQWRLSEEGRERCSLLSERVASYSPSSLFSSLEPKALETAEMIGSRLNLSTVPVHDLHEHDREHVPLLSRAEIQSLIKSFFNDQDTLVFGEETAQQAMERFTQAVDGIVTTQQNGNLAIVTHGTVITLLVSAHNGIDPYCFWQRLALPDMVVLELPHYRLVADENTF